MRLKAWRIVEGTEKEPEDAKKLESYDERAGGAYVDLIGALKGDLKAMALQCSSVADAWKKLKEICVINDTVLIQKLEEEIINTEFRGSVLQMITRLDTLYERLQAAGVSFGDDLKTMRLLQKLPKRYGELVIYIKINDDFKVNKKFVYSKVTDFLKKRAVAEGDFGTVQNFHK